MINELTNLANANKRTCGLVDLRSNEYPSLQFKDEAVMLKQLVYYLDC